MEITFQCTIFSFIRCYIVLFRVEKIKSIIILSLEKTHSVVSHIYFIHLSYLSLGEKSM